MSPAYIIRPPEMPAKPALEAIAAGARSGDRRSGDSAIGWLSPVNIVLCEICLMIALALGAAFIFGIAL